MLGPAGLPMAGREFNAQGQAVRRGCVIGTLRGSIYIRTWIGSTAMEQQPHGHPYMPTDSASHSLRVEITELPGVGTEHEIRAHKVSSMEVRVKIDPHTFLRRNTPHMPRIAVPGMVRVFLHVAQIQRMQVVEAYGRLHVYFEQ